MRGLFLSSCQFFIRRESSEPCHLTYCSRELRGQTQLEMRSKTYLFLKSRFVEYDYRFVRIDSGMTTAGVLLMAGSFELKYRDTNRSTIERSGSAANSSALLAGVASPSAIAAVCPSLRGSKSSSGASLKYPLISSIYSKVFVRPMSRNRHAKETSNWN